MAINVFVYFPENDDEIFNVNNKLINDFGQMVRLLDNNYTLYYDEDNVNTYLSKSNVLGIYLSDPRSQLQIILRQHSAISITKNSIRQSSCIYITWNLDECPTVKYTQNILAEISERIFQYPQESHLLLNIQNAISTCREKILVFKDAKHLSDIPKEFAHIDFVFDSLGLELWLNTKNITAFSLQKQSRFRRTKFIQQGKPVFEENSTGYFWYMDNFHQNEYEVFNSQKEHIGVADMLGNINFGKKVKGRTFD